MGTLTLLPILFYLLIKYLGMCPNLNTKWAQSGHKVDTWAHSLRAVLRADGPVGAMCGRMPITTNAHHDVGIFVRSRKRGTGAKGARPSGRDVR